MPRTPRNCPPGFGESLHSTVSSRDAGPFSSKYGNIPAHDVPISRTVHRIHVPRATFGFVYQYSSSRSSMVGGSTDANILFSQAYPPSREFHPRLDTIVLGPATSFVRLQPLGQCAVDITGDAEIKFLVPHPGICLCTLFRHE